MSETVSNLASIVRGLVSLLILGLVGTGGWFVYREYDARGQLNRDLAARTAEIEQLEQDKQQLAEEKQELAEQNARITEENVKLNLALRLMKVDHRVAEVEVLDQVQGDERPRTRFRFSELTSDGQPAGEPQVFTVDGDTIYIDAWVIKYADEHVEQGDPLRSTSVCLFRRIFGEHQQPSEGFALDKADARPAVYSQGSEMSDLERDIWANFWEYANDPQKAKQGGLRAAHGEAPSIRLEPGKRYRVDLRASAGLTIVPEEPESKPAL
jgi:cell division protein FtsB